MEMVSAYTDRDDWDRSCWVGTPDSPGRIHRAARGWPAGRLGRGGGGSTWMKNCAEYKGDWPR